MEHPQIDDEKVIDRYLVGRLSSEDEALFEEHLFACSDCLLKVEWGDELRRGLRTVAAEDAARAAVSLGLVAWLRSRRPAQLGALVGLALVLALLPAVALWQQTELSRLRLAQQTAVGGGGFVAPMGDFSVVSLGVVRDVIDVVEIRPDPRKTALLLSLELQAVDASRYRVTLRDATGGTLWIGDQLEPNLYDTLLVAMPTSFLSPGSYRITVEGVLAADEQSVGKLAGEMEFRILSEK